MSQQQQSQLHNSINNPSGKQRVSALSLSHFLMYVSVWVYVSVCVSACTVHVRVTIVNEKRKKSNNQNCNENVCQMESNTIDFIPSFVV